MKVNRRYVIIIVFIMAECASAYLVFNYTTRTRKPNEIYVFEDDITRLGISSSGNSLAIGINGELYFFQKGKTSPIWVYHGDSQVVSIALSTEGDYVASMDGNHRINLFSDLPYTVSDKLRPKWTYSFPQGTVAGIHPSGGMPPLVHILVTIGGKISVLSNIDGIVWEYQTAASHVTAELSSDGRRVVAVDSQGEVYLFNINNAEPIWKTSTELTEVSLSLYQDSAMAVGGKFTDGGGRVYVFSLKGSESIWGWNSLKPISYVSISSKDQVVAKQLDGDAYILRYMDGKVKERVIDIPGRVQTVISSSFGSYVAATNYEGQLYFLYTPRDTPMWFYNARYDSPKVAISSTGEKVFVATDREVAVIYNTFQTGFILGSRRLWGFVFFAGLFGAIGIYTFVFGRKDWLVNDVYRHIVIFYGFLLGALLGYFLEGGSISVVGGVGCAAGVLYSRRSEGLLGLMVAFFASLISSFVAGYFFGLMQWFSGYEANIIALTVVNASRGGRLGVIVAIIGVLLGKVSSSMISGSKFYAK